MDKFERVLQKQKEKGREQALAIRFTGNYGDTILWRGCKKRLKDLSISISVVTPEKEISKITYLLLHASFNLSSLDVPEKIRHQFQNLLTKRIFFQFLQEKTISDTHSQQKFILVHGSGTMGTMIPTKLLLLRSIIRRFPHHPIIIGPQSYWISKKTIFKNLFSKMLAFAEQEIHLFTREKYSFKLLKSMTLPKNVEVHLSPDTAFYLSKEDFNPKHGEYDLVWLRSDHESIVSPRVKTNLSKSLSNAKIVSDKIVHSGQKYVESVERAKRVITDHLHVAILGTIMEKETVFLPNAYYKNSGVYEYSLRHYPNVRFIRRREIPSLPKKLQKN